MIESGYNNPSKSKCCKLFWATLSWSPGLGQNTSSRGLFSKKFCSTIKIFSSSNMFFIRLFLANTRKKNRGSSCSFKRKEFISLSSLVWGKSLAFCTCTCPCARADDAKIVRSRDAQCNTKELPEVHSFELWVGCEMHEFPNIVFCLHFCFLIEKIARRKKPLWACWNTFMGEQIFWIDTENALERG